jgi:hypothetical protein
MESIKLDQYCPSRVVVVVVVLVKREWYKSWTLYGPVETWEMTKAKRSSEGEMESKEEIHINIYIYTRRIKENRGGRTESWKASASWKSLSLWVIYIYFGQHQCI